MRHLQQFLIKLTFFSCSLDSNPCIRKKNFYAQVIVRLADILKEFIEALKASDQIKNLQSF